MLAKLVCGFCTNTGVCDQSDNHEVYALLTTVFMPRIGLLALDLQSYMWAKKFFGDKGHSKNVTPSTSTLWEQYKNDLSILPGSCQELSEALHA